MDDQLDSFLACISNYKLTECCGLLEDSEGNFSIKTFSQFEIILADILNKCKTLSQLKNLDLATKRAFSKILLCTLLHEYKGSWRSEDTAKVSISIITEMCRILNVKDITYLFIENVEQYETTTAVGLFKYVFEHILKLFISNTTDKSNNTNTNVKANVEIKKWKDTESAKYLVIAILLNIPFPYLSQYLNTLFPILLRMLDDFESSYILLGMQGMLYLVNNVTPTELKWYNRAEVIYSAIVKRQFSHDPSILSMFHPLVFAVLAIIEHPPTKFITKDAPRGLTRYDTVLNSMLQQMLFVSDYKIKQIYILMLKDFIGIFGYVILRHLKELFKVINSYLEMPDFSGEEIRFSCLAILESLFGICPNEFKYEVNELTLSLLKVLMHSCVSRTDSTLRSDVYKRLVARVTEVCHKLYQCDKCSDILMGFLGSIGEPEKRVKIVDEFITNFNNEIGRKRNSK